MALRVGDIVRIVDTEDPDACNCSWKVTGFGMRKLFETDPEEGPVVLLTRLRVGSNCTRTGSLERADNCTWVPEPWFEEKDLELDEEYTAWTRFYEHPEQEILR